jgi:hypothetical protein
VITSWRGELVWHGFPLGIGWVDRITLWLTFAVLLGASLSHVQAVRNRRAETFCLICCFGIVAGGLVFISLVSLAWDFGAAFYPSQKKPFLISGRLISGALTPFAVLCVAGLRAWARTCHVPRLWAPVLVLIMLMCLVSDLTLTLPVFASQWNWYHLP